MDIHLARQYILQNFFSCFQFLCRIQRNPSKISKQLGRMVWMVKITPPQISITQKKKMIHVKCHINPQWGNFYNMLFFNSKNCLNGKNHSSSGSHHHLKIPLPPTFPSPQWADIPNPLMLFWKYRKIWDKSRIQWCCLLS